MKKILYLIAALAVIYTIDSCRKLDVPEESQYTPSNFPTTPADYSALLGGAYANLASQFAVNYWRMQELTTDEAILPARDGNFDDGGQYRLSHYHTYTVDHPYPATAWNWAFGGINTLNSLIPITSASNATAAQKALTLAQIRALRALYYFYMMDTFGNVPIIDTFPVLNQPATQPRAKVFTFLETELKAIAESLPEKTATNAAATYGTPTRAMIFAILAKMYLNAQVYTGTSRYDDCVAMCDSIMKPQNYSLDASYRSIFLPTNGSGVNETIFAIVYDQQIPTNQMTRFGFSPFLNPSYGLPLSGSTAMSTTSNFFSTFYLANDFRNKTWLTGPQFFPDGNGGFTTQPALIPTTTTQVVLSTYIICTGLKPMDVGNTTASQEMGVRSIKFYPDPTYTSATRLNGNDFPVFRLADIMLMKAEAILRGAAQTTISGVPNTPLELINAVRARAGAPAAPSIVLDSIVPERGRELSWEAWRRNDLIRFGLYEKNYPLVGDTITMNQDPTRRLWPIPRTQIVLNPNLVQNPGY